MQDLPDSSPSLWLAEYGDYRPEPSLEGELDVDAAVIGGGLTGMATALALKRRDPSLEVAVLEAKTVGYGASGRNGSFAMTVVGLGFGTTAMLRGKPFLRRAHGYMERCVDELDRFIDEAGLKCDKVRPGFLRVATTPSYVKRLQKQVELMASLGFEGISWLDAAATREMVNSERYLGAMWEPRLVLVNPAKLVREQKRVALELGVRVFEGTPVLAVAQSPAARDAEPVHRLLTPRGALTAHKLAFATNAYSHLFEQLGRLQVPAFTYMIATEPLTDEQLAPIGWRWRSGDRGRPQPHSLLPADSRQAHRARRRPGRPHDGRQPRRRRRRAGVATPRAVPALAVAAPVGRRDHLPLGRPVLGDARPHPGARVRRRRPNRRLRARLHRSRRLDELPQRRGADRAAARRRPGTRCGVPVRQPARDPVAAASRLRASPSTRSAATCGRKTASTRMCSHVSSAADRATPGSSGSLQGFPGLRREPGFGTVCGDTHSRGGSCPAHA